MNCKFKEYPACNDFFKNCPSAEYVEVSKDKVCKFMQARFVCEIADEKRKPLPDDSLPLTKEELEEFSKITGLRIILVELIAGNIYISYRTETGEEENGYVTDVKAILWLAERFELTSNN